MSFSSLALRPELLDALVALGYQDATPIQLAAIPAILAKQDVMAGAQTGTGKTAAFALPILQQLICAKHASHQVRALVLTPTRELAQQVFQSIERYGQFTDIRCALAYGGVSIKPQIAALHAGVDILVATPGRLLDHLINDSLSLAALEFLVFDEADRMLDLGFQDEIRHILKRVPAKRQTMLFSATFDDALFNLSKTMLKQPKLIEVSSRNSAASQVEQVVYSLDAKRKREFTSFLIGSKNWQQVLIFTRTKQGADELAQQMCLDGINTQSLHGDKSQGAREKALAEFKRGKIRALVATDVAARGLDIADLQYVLNYELPYIAEDYVHRIGRTGRAGKVGLAISLVSPKEGELLTAIEQVLGKPLLAQWYPGYEPDLAKLHNNDSKLTKGAQKQRARKKAFATNARKKPR